MKTKKILFLMIILLSIIMILISGKKVSDKNKTKISFWCTDAYDDNKNAVWQQLADEYMAVNPKVLIEVSIIPNEALKQKLSVSLVSGELPDIFSSWGGDKFNELVKAGLLKDITKELKGTNWGKSFFQSTLNVYSYDNKYYGVPYDMGAIGIWYNKKIFKELDLKPFKTWDELIEAVKKIKESGYGYIPISLGSADKWPASFWWTYLATRIGGKEAFIKAYNGQGAFNDTVFIEAGKKLVELIELKPFQVGFLDASYIDQETLIGSSKAVMELMGHWTPYVQQSYFGDDGGLEDDLGWMPFPMIEGGKGNPDDLIGGGNGIIISKNAPKETIDFLKYITNIENQKILIKTLEIIPTVKGLKNEVNEPHKKIIYDMLDKAEYLQLYYDQYLPLNVGSTILNTVYELFSGKTSPENVADLIEESMSNVR